MQQDITGLAFFILIPCACFDKAAWFCTCAKQKLKTEFGRIFHWWTCHLC